MIAAEWKVKKSAHLHTVKWQCQCQVLTVTNLQHLTPMWQYQWKEIKIIRLRVAKAATLVPPRAREI
jgi:hypothetical protein